jgi:putative transposase
MPRLARVVIPQFPHHVTQRGNARRDVFFNPQDRQVYLGLLRQYSKHYSVQILGYCLMTNHVHFVALPAYQESLGKMLREVHGRYGRYRNAIERGSGHLWQSRYYSCAFEWVRMATVMRYVELNPVRARLVRRPEDYAWSSAAIHLGGTDARGLVELEDWQRDWTPEVWARWLDDGTEQIEAQSEAARAIREATYGGHPWGSEEFVRGLEARLERKLTLGKPGRPKKEKALAAGM